VAAKGKTSNMTPKQRVVAVCEHRPTDRVPVYHASISSRMASLVLGREAYVGGGMQQWREAAALWNGEDAHGEFLERTKRDTIDLAEPLGVDMVRVTYWRLNEKPTRRIDDHTFLYGDPDSEWRTMRFDPGTELYQTVDWYPRVETTETDLETQVEQMELGLDAYRPGPEAFPDILMGIEELGGQREVAGGYVGIGVDYRSQAWITAVASRPDLVERWLDVSAERAIRNVEGLKDVDVRVMLGGGDMATNEGPIYSPNAFRELLIPRLRRIVDACHEHGKYYFFASDGDLWPVADDLFPVVDGYYEIDRRAGMDLRKLRQRYPHLRLVGNISSHTLHLGTKAEVIDEARSCLEAAREFGSIMVGCSNLIMCQTPEENFFAMLDVLRQES
jgi:uroporphyrinogen-III decarboxylase